MRSYLAGTPELNKEETRKKQYVLQNNKYNDEMISTDVEDTENELTPK